MAYRDDEDDEKIALPVQQDRESDIPSEVEPIQAKDEPAGALPELPEEPEQGLEKELDDSEQLGAQLNEGDDLDQKIAEATASPDRAHLDFGNDAMSISPSPAPSKWEQLLKQYSDLQKSQQRSNAWMGILDSLGQVGQAMATRWTPNYKLQSQMPMFEKMNAVPVSNFENQQKMSGTLMQLQQLKEMNDADSPTSQAYREYANKRLGLNLPETMPAASIQNILKGIGRPVQTKFQKVNGTYKDPTSGKTVRVTASYDPVNHTFLDGSGNPLPPDFRMESLAPMQIVTGEHGEKMQFNKSAGGAPTPITKPTDFNKVQSPQEIYNGLYPETRKELDGRIVPSFNKLTEKAQQRLSHVPNILARLEESLHNPAALNQLRAEMARFDVGDQRLAQQEFNMFAKRHGYKSWEDFAQEHSTGTITPDFANDFKQTVLKTAGSIKQDLNQQAEKHAKLLISRMPKDQQSPARIIAPLIYSGYQPSLREKQSGQIKPIKPELYQQALDSGLFEEVK